MPPPSDPFKAIRAEILMRFDAEVATLRSLLCDPTIANPSFANFTQAQAEIGHIIEEMCRVNEVAKMKGAPHAD